ncbi:hypothetical protein EYF80_054214 [Liparis tanakae]|uniref:Uncharacterized protein n=1 Tax=Liparis tanakae TaxID=230148 RepID=A0A4Z2F4D0_9TELE|nr:hypothetical protein EYF80_054214 [Liparis tanakae]
MSSFCISPTPAQYADEQRAGTPRRFAGTTVESPCGLCQDVPPPERVEAGKSLKTHVAVRIVGKGFILVGSWFAFRGGKSAGGKTQVIIHASDSYRVH